MQAITFIEHLAHGLNAHRTFANGCDAVMCRNVVQREPVAGRLHPVIGALRYPAGAGASWFDDATTTPCFCIAFATFLLTSETRLFTLFGSIVLLSAE